MFKSKKFWIIAIISLLVVAALIIVGTKIAADKKHEEKINESLKEAQVEKFLNDTQENVAAIKDSKNKKYSLGERVKLMGYAIKLDSYYEHSVEIEPETVEEEIVETEEMNDTESQPELETEVVELSDSKKYVVCKFIFENNTDKDFTLDIEKMFKATVSGQPLNAVPYEDLKIENDASAHHNIVKAGESSEVVIAYSVDMEWEEIEISFTTDTFGINKALFVLIND